MLPSTGLVGTPPSTAMKMVPPAGGRLTWMPEIEVPPQNTPTGFPPSDVRALTELPVYALTDGVKLLPHVSIWTIPPWVTVHAYHTDAPPGPGSPASVVAFTF